jgi:hypothetical protein
VNETHTSLPKKRSGWIGFLSACLFLLVITLIFGFYWWQSDADLVDIRKKAAANNIPVTWAEFGLKKSEPDRLARWKRIVSLSNKLPSYQSLKNGDNPEFVLFSPIPAEMSAHHATLDETIWTELLHELELFGDQPLCFHDTITFDTFMPEIGEYRTLLRQLQERSALADVPEALRLCSVQLAVCRSFKSNSLISHLVKTSLLSIALSSVSYHLADFKTLDSPLAENITLTTALYSQQLINGLAGEFLCALQSTSKPETNLAMGWYMPLVVRAGRHELLSAEIESLVHLRDHDLLTRLAWQRKQMATIMARKKSIPSSGSYLVGMVMPHFDIVTETTYETLLKGQLIAAELKNQTWPTDIFDPTGAPIRPVLRDGKIIGAYTVYSNGVDDGGDKKLDRYFPLYGPLELPVAPTTP